MSRAREFADLASSADAGGLTGRNLVINGGMKISARGTSFTGFGASVNYSLDRFAHFHNSDGAFTVSQETSVVPTDFTHALKVQTTTADASIAADQRLIVFTRCEGNTVSHLNWGTSDAKTVTLSFYVRSSITGTHGGAFANGSDNRNYPFTYTINSADTWERKTITVAGDTSGTWATGTGRSLQVVWGLGVGSTYSGTAGAWAAGDKNSATGATTDVLGTLNATWYLTGVQLEVGEKATPFEHRLFDDELNSCLRYYHTSNIGDPDGSLNGGASGIAFDAAEVAVCYEFPVPMRATPTITLRDNAGNTARVHRMRSADHGNSTTASLINKTGFANFASSGMTTNAGYLGGVEADAEL
jgi:hypothetical protein